MLNIAVPKVSLQSASVMALVGQGITVRFTVAGVTSLRCALAIGFALLALTTVRTSFYELSRRAKAPRGPASWATPLRWTGRGPLRTLRGVPEISRTQKPFLRFALLAGRPDRGIHRRR